MYIHALNLKHSKRLFGRRMPNDNGLDIRLATMAHPTYVGAIIITRELESGYRGHLVRITHEEFKQGILKTLKAEDIPG